jgi:hypothetical protein
MHPAIERTFANIELGAIKLALSISHVPYRVRNEKQSYDWLFNIRRETAADDTSK